MEKSIAKQLREEFDLKTPLAIWVAFSHLFVLATPLSLIWVVYYYNELMPHSMTSPILVMLACSVYLGATAFEVAQNSADRWYLTKVSRSVADLFFNGLMTLSFCMFTIGFSSTLWMTITAIFLTILYPIAYINNHPSFRAINGIVVIIACYSLYRITQDPMAFLFLLGNALGVYCIYFLIKSRAQWMHGLAAFIFGIGFFTWPLAILNAANGSQISWLFLSIS
ncbi:MAG: hypothetical protein VYA80_01060, partial [Pseudomonadota bacterium]|nr:hypothetical protein [Pseudomonadota bacterium]